MKITLATNEIQLRHQLELALETLGECYQASNLTKKRLIEIALRSGHRSILEHFDLVFRLKEISYCTHAQLVRHRKTSPMTQSQRYTLPNKTVIPFKNGTLEYDLFQKISSNIVKEVEDLKISFVDAGKNITMQQLRYAKSQGTAISMTIKLNLRSFLELIEKRDVDGAMPETREIVVAMRNACLKSEVLREFIVGHCIVRRAQEIADKWLQENWEAEKDRMS